MKSSPARLAEVIGLMMTNQIKAIIVISYVVAAAASVILLNFSTEGDEQIKQANGEDKRRRVHFHLP